MVENNLNKMDLIVSRNIKFLNSLVLPGQDKIVFPESRFNYNRNKMGMSAYSLQGRMTHLSTQRDPHIWSPFDADDLSRCLWWIIDNPVHWEIEKFLSIASANPQWKGLIVKLIPLVQELMMAPSREEPELSKWIRQIMNDSIDPPPHRNIEEAQQILETLKRQENDKATLLEIRQLNHYPFVYEEHMKLWRDFRSRPKKLTNDLITLASKDKRSFYIVASKHSGHVQVLLQKNNRWISKITWAPIFLRIYLVK